MARKREADAASSTAAIADCHCFALRRAARRISQSYDLVLAPTGLRMSQLSMLALVQSLGEPTIGRLAEAIDLDRTTAGKNLRPLERAGLVKTAPSASDKRSRVVAVTARGRRTLAEAEPLWRAAQARYEARNGAAAIARVERALAGFDFT